MIALCKTNEAFEDTLTSHQSYRILELRNASVLILNDKGEARWYGLGRFTLGHAAEH